MLASTMLFFRWASVFNTNSGDWLNETLNGDVPTDRMYHTATLCMYSIIYVTNIVYIIFVLFSNLINTYSTEFPRYTSLWRF